MEDMISRLETMILMGTDIPLQAIRKQIASSLDIVVHLGRLRDKTRKVLEIVEIGDYIDGEIQYNPLYRFEELPIISENTNYNGEQTKVMGVLRATGNSLKNTRKLKAAGLYAGSERSAGDA